MIDPRTVLLGVIPAATALFFLNVGETGLFLVFLHLLFLFSSGSRRELVPLWKRLFPLLVMILILWPLFEPSRVPLWEWRFLKLGPDNLISAARTGLRLVCLVMIFTYPLAVKGQSSLMTGLVKLGMPYPFTFTVVLAVETVPDLTERWRRVRQAQQLRGWDPGRGGTGPAGLIKRIRNWLPLLTAVIVGALVDSEELAGALVNRGMEREGERSWLEEPRFRWYDGLILLLLTGGALWIIMRP